MGSMNLEGGEGLVDECSANRGIKRGDRERLVQTRTKLSLNISTDGAGTTETGNRCSLS